MMEEKAQLVHKLNQTSLKESIRPSLIMMERHWFDRSLCRAGMSILKLSFSLTHTHKPLHSYVVTSCHPQPTHNIKSHMTKLSKVNYGHYRCCACAWSVWWIDHKKKRGFKILPQLTYWSNHSCMGVVLGCCG